MKRIAISAENNNGLDSTVCGHFGGSPYFILVDVDGDTVISLHGVANPYFPEHQPGQVPAFIRSQSVQAMVSGGMGARAVALFQTYGVETATGASGTVRLALDQYLAGTLPTAEPCAHGGDHGHGGCQRRPFPA